MGGICCVMNLDKNSVVIDKKSFKNMVDLLKHRGPDSNYFMFDKNIHMGSTNLEYSKNSTTTNEKEGVYIILDGCIFNRENLSKKLEKDIKTDGELIIQLYKNFGEGFLRSLEGLFAFILYDSNKKKLLAARDRFGFKPIHYTIFNNHLILSSEIKSILNFPGFKRNLNFKGLHNYLVYITYIPGTETIFEGVARLESGHFLTLSNGRLLQKKYSDYYWNYERNIKMKKESYYLKSFETLLKNAIKKNVLSDYPLVATLSGGVDTSTIIFFLKEITGREINTITTGYTFESHLNEMGYARKVAEKFGTNHHEILVDSSEINLLPKLLWHFDTVYCDGVAILQYLVSKKSCQLGARTTLNGFGVETLMGGDRRAKFQNYARKIGFFIPSIVKQKYLKNLRTKSPKINKAISLLQNSDKYEELYMLTTPSFPEDEIRVLYSRQLSKKLNGFRGSSIIKNYLRKEMDSYTQGLYLKGKMWQTGFTLERNDIIGLSNSNEQRVPFLENQLANFCYTLPGRMKIRRFKEKYLLRKLIKNKVPKEVLTKPKKGWHLPVDVWVNEQEGIISQAIEGLGKRQYFDKGKLASLLNNRNKYQDYLLIWSLFNFEIWHRMFLDSEKLPKRNISLNGLI